MSRHSTTVETSRTSEDRSLGRSLGEQYERMFRQLDEFCVDASRLAHQIDHFQPPQELAGEMEDDCRRIAGRMLDLKSEVMSLKLNAIDHIALLPTRASDDPADDVDLEDDPFPGEIVPFSQLVFMIYSKAIEAGLVDENGNPSEKVKAVEQEILNRTGQASDNQEAAEA